MPTIDIGQRTLSYRDTGAGFPIVFGHSYLWDADMWQPQVEALSDRFRCVVPDLWGHGDSAPPPPGSVYSLDQLTFDYQQFLDVLNLERCLVVGLSVGGMWGYRLALTNPGQVAGLLLAGTDAGGEPDESRRRYFGMIDAVAAEGAITPAMIELLLPLFFGDRTLVEAPPYVGGLRRALASLAPERLPGVLALGRGIFGRPNLLHHLKQITCPTTVVVGEQDRSRSPFEARRMAEGIAGAHLHILPRAGHICNLEAPESFTALIEALMERVAP